MPRPQPDWNDRHDATLVDHHCHGVATAELDRQQFERFLTESAYPAAQGMSHFDTPLGLAIRRWCAPVLDREPGVAADEYLQRRAELGAAEVNQRLLRAARLGAVLVDTGHAPPGGTAPDELATMAGAVAHEVVRIERVAEDVLAAIQSPRQFTDAFEQRLRTRANAAVGLKSIVAYRGGLALASRPTQRQVEAAVEQVLAGREGAVRLANPVLLRHSLEIAADVASDRGLPVQFHTGFGDADLQLDQSNPTLLTPLLRDFGHRGVTVALLHCYPYHREAGYLATVFPHVHLDVGLTVPHAGAGSHRVLAEALELAPFGKHLFSSDAFGLAELFLVAASLFRRSLRSILGAWIADGDCTVSDAERVERAITSENARRIYALEPEEP